MFCTNCGQPIEGGAAFCPSCGAWAGDAGSPPQSYTQSYTQPYTQAAAPAPGARRAKKAKRANTGFRARFAVIPAGALIALAAIFFGGRALLGVIRYNSAMSGAAAAASGGDYAGAVELYRSALNIRQGDGRAARALTDSQEKAIRDNISEVQALLNDGQYDKAYKLGRELPIIEGDDAYDWHAGYLECLKARPRIETVDPAYFPVVSVTVAYTGGAELEGASIGVAEDGSQAQVVSAEIAGGTARIAFAARDTDIEAENREIAVSIITEDLVIPIYGSYATPAFADAALTLVTTDISEYPTVRAYFKVEDRDTGERVRNLLISSFEISESVAGGAYLAREVKSAKSLLDAGDGDAGAGINIGLIADKSDSISAADMAKIKQVMAQFADGLQYKQGDKAEVLAFDSIVQQMCTYTNNVDLLKNGIGNMATDGM
ncbi:MAG: zinc ribbon domain-containing protein, partial [Oscillospiraceae bacterium]|nr:zinc ribbon domain-containing protein [Oscillospiraceae bacterium]